MNDILNGREFNFCKIVLQGILLNDIVNRSKFVSDQREIVLAAIRRIEPQFEPIYTPPKALYNNDLVNHLNQYIKPIEEPVNLNVS